MFQKKSDFITRIGSFPEIFLHVFLLWVSAQLGVEREIIKLEIYLHTLKSTKEFIFTLKNFEINSFGRQIFHFELCRNIKIRLQCRTTNISDVAFLNICLAWFLHT